VLCPKNSPFTIYEPSSKLENHLAGVLYSLARWFVSCRHSFQWEPTVYRQVCHHFARLALAATAAMLRAAPARRLVRSEFGFALSRFFSPLILMSAVPYRADDGLPLPFEVQRSSASMHRMLNYDPASNPSGLDSVFSRVAQRGASTRTGWQEHCGASGPRAGIAADLVRKTNCTV